MHALDCGIAQMALCFDAQERRAPGWGDAAYAFLVRWAAQQRLPFSAEDFTIAAREAGIGAADARAFGAVFRRAQRDGVIRRSDVSFRRRFGHGTPTLGWERCT